MTALRRNGTDPPPGRGIWQPRTKAECDAVREQLERVLATPYFCNSKRYPALLRYVTERLLQGEEVQKERTLGVVVFGRDPDYDTNQDTVVRTTAAEIRRRLAQYYQEPGHENELRIEFPPGSYTPNFHLPDTGAFTEPAATPLKSFRRPLYVLAAVAVIILVTAAAVFVPRRSDERSRFWSPVWSSNDVALLCVGGLGFADEVAAKGSVPVTVSQLQSNEEMAFADATTLALLSGVFAVSSKPFHIRRDSATDLEELRHGPLVLIGAFNNAWTMRLSSSLRFRPVRKGQSIWIEDARNPGARDWSIQVDQPFASQTADYAIVARYQDSTINRPVVIVAGLTKYATRAAGEFIADDSYLSMLSRGAPSDWYRKNIEVVLETKIVGCELGSAADSRHLLLVGPGRSAAFCEIIKSTEQSLCFSGETPIQAV